MSQEEEKQKFVPSSSWISSPKYLFPELILICILLHEGMKTMKTPGFLSSVSPSSKSLSLRVVFGSFHTTVMCANNIYGVK